MVVLNREMEGRKMSISNYILEVEVNGEISDRHEPVRLEDVSRNFAVAEAIAICEMEGQRYLLPDSVSVNIICEKSGNEQLVKSGQ
jgi:hypothetical protein